MKIEFATKLPVADALVIPVQKNGLDTAIGGRAGQEVLAAAAAAARFEGEAGSIAEAFVGGDGAVNRI
ncbi:MAG: leucyl aminopeptidase, partial [Sphingomonadales bacterium]|nr:leucyl aminopeptidase [Sphingomonadales bacterium]